MKTRPMLPFTPHLTKSLYNVSFKPIWDMDIGGVYKGACAHTSRARGVGGWVGGKFVRARAANFSVIIFSTIPKY